MIYGLEHLAEEPTRIEADLCVVGSGAGGAPVAEAVAAAGHRVVVLEAGSFWRPSDFTQREEEMFPRLYHEKGGRATADMAIRVHQGKGVGGSTLHNLNLCVRLPDAVLEAWRAEHGLEGLEAEDLAGLFGEVEDRLDVSTFVEEDLNENNRILRRGCEALGHEGGFLRHNRVGCTGAGFCELGCPFDAKQNAAKVYIPGAVEDGAIVCTNTWATRVLHDGSRATGVEARVRDPETGEVLQPVEVTARAVCLSASATGTPAILRRSGVPDPDGLVGSRLFLHPGAAVAGVFPDMVRGWQGIPQTWECTEFLDLSPGSEDRTWIVPAFAHPAGVSSIIGGFGREHARIMEDYPRLAAASPMIHDETVGRVGPDGEFGVSIEYWLDEADRREMRRGLREVARILLAAGAEKVLLPFSETLEATGPDELDRHLDGRPIRRHDLEITSVHPMGSVWMGDDPATACCDARGRYHRLEDLFVADTSLFPTSLGVPPQLTTYALGTRVGRTIRDHLS